MRLVLASLSTTFLAALVSACNGSSAAPAPHPPAPTPSPAEPSPARPRAPLSAAELADYQRGCHEDADCARVRNGCCACENGGRSAAVLREKAGPLAAQFTCADVPCPAIYNPACEAERAVCRAGSCTIATL
jgi:hypothetical protein